MQKVKNEMKNKVKVFSPENLEYEGFYDENDYREPEFDEETLRRLDEIKRYEIPPVYKTKLLNKIRQYLEDKKDKAKLVEIQKVVDAEGIYNQTER